MYTDVCNTHFKTRRPCHMVLKSCLVVTPAQLYNTEHKHSVTFGGIYYVYGKNAESL